jgi:FtsZ-interacting cell division protein YlmF
VRRFSYDLSGPAGHRDAQIRHALTHDEARQLVDFAAGLICARGGDMERLSPKVSMLVPAGLAKPGAAANKAEESA